MSDQKSESEAPVVTDRRRAAQAAQDHPDNTGQPTDTESGERQRYLDYLRDRGVEVENPDDLSVVELQGRMLAYQAKQQLEEEQQQPEGQSCLTAFLVIVDFDGAAMATQQLDRPLLPERSATFTDMFTASHQVIKDLTTMETTARVMDALATQAQSMAKTRLAMEAQRQQPAAKSGKRSR